jgi:hypothetical protein
MTNKHRIVAILSRDQTRTFDGKNSAHDEALPEIGSSTLLLPG